MSRTAALLLFALSAFVITLASAAGYAATVNISASENIETVVNSNPAGTTFVIAPGVYRMQSITPKSGDVFEGQTGAVLNGSRELSSFTRSGNYYVATGQTQHGTANGECLAGYAGCEYPEDLFFNNVPLQRVESLTDVAAGKWYFDYSTATIYFVDNPAGKTVEIGVTTHAFSGDATNVIIENLTIEKYADPAQDGAISAGENWTIKSNQILLNHGGGIRLNTGEVVQSNYVHHNGQEGLTGSGSNILVESNEIAYNNTLSFDFEWQAGGTKFSETTNLVVEGNYVHNNYGQGMSLDYESYNWLVQGNRTAGNYVAGIIDELGYNGTARYNIIENDASYPGKTDPSMWWACGLLVLDSSYADIYGNTLINNSNGICAISISRGSGNRGAFLVQNLSVHDNVIVQSAGSATGAVADSGTYMDVYSSSWNNHWTSNTYQLASSDPSAFVWEKGSTGYSSYDASHWKAFGQDTAGTWISAGTSTIPIGQFSAYAGVSTVASTEVWSLPTTTSTLLKTEASGTQGTITQVAGPILSGGSWWWNVKFADGTVGWCTGPYLASA